ncbi:MAG: FAD-dependent oxidoreductase, partial [Chloroflexota bacterium]
MVRRHVLIGDGPGAMAAAEAIRSADESAQIVVVGADPHGFYSRPGLAYFLTNEMPEKQLFPFSREEIATLGLSFVGERAIGVDPAEHRVALESGRLLEYDRLLLATGSGAIMPGIPGVELDGVVKLDDMDDARDIARRARGVKVAVVVGGGITALEIVEGLRARGVHVHYFMRRERYWSNVLSESESRIVEQALWRESVDLHPFTELARIHGRDGRVTAAETGEGLLVRCSIVAVAVGVRPRIELAAAAGLACGRGVLVDAYLRSSDPHIYAAGDVAEVWDEHTGRRTLDVLWNVALAKGRIAGRNMAGEPVVKYGEGSPLNVTRLAGLKTTIIGTVGRGQDADL